jgi:hypothetical protein
MSEPSRKGRKTIIQPARFSYLAAIQKVPAYDWRERKAVARLIQSDDRKILNYVELFREIHQARINASVAIYERLRAAPAAVRLALDEIAAHLAAARESIDRLGYDAGRLFRDAAEAQDPRPEGDTGETIWQWLEPKDWRASGQSRVTWVKRAILDCEAWSKTASEAVDVPRRGRPSNKAAKELVVELAEIWKFQTGIRPTLTNNPITNKREGNFIDLCLLVSQPIWDAYDLKLPVMQEIAQSHLYRQQKGEK